MTVSGAFRWLQRAGEGTLLEPVIESYQSVVHLEDRRLLLLGIASFLDELSVSVIVPLLPIYIDQLGVSPFMIGIIYAAETISKSVFSSPFGYLSDHIGRRALIIVGLLVSAVSVIAYGFVGAPVLFIAFRLFDGVGTAMRNPATTAYIGDAFPEEERASAMSAYRTLSMLGVVFGPMIGGVLVAVSSIRVPFVVLGIGTLLGSILLALYLPPSEESEEEESFSIEELKPSLPSPSKIFAADAPLVPVLVVGTTALVGALATGAFYPFLPILLEQTVGRGASYAGFAWSAFGLSMFLFLPVGGTLSDKFGRKKSLLAGQALWGGVALALSQATLLLLPPIILFLGGLASAFSGPALGSLKYEISPDDYEGTFIGLYSTLGSVGASIGPIAAGAVVTQTGPQFIFVLIGMLWLLVTVILFLGIPAEA